MPQLKYFNGVTYEDWMLGTWGLLTPKKPGGMQ
jgi:hypothetical protein